MDLKKPFQTILLCIRLSQRAKDVDAERRLHITNRFANNGPTNALKKIVKIEKPFALHCAIPSILRFIRARIY